MHRDDHHYDDIIHLPRPVSKNHPPMPIADRAAQFSPFAALTGYEAAIQETGRLTDEKIELDEQSRAILDGKLQSLAQDMDRKPQVCITYFLPDKRKSGGQYLQKEGTIKRIDAYARTIVFDDGVSILIDDILDIQSDALHHME